MFKDGLVYVGKQLLLVILLCLLGVVVFAVGLMVGYAVVGDGQQATDILSPDKWQDIFAKFTGK